MAQLEIPWMVRYYLTEEDAEAVNRRIKHALDHMGEHRARSDGSVVHVGNYVEAGQPYPMVVVQLREFGRIADGQVFVPGNIPLWKEGAVLSHLGRFDTIPRRPGTFTVTIDTQSGL